MHEDPTSELSRHPPWQSRRPTSLGRGRRDVLVRDGTVSGTGAGRLPQEIDAPRGVSMPKRDSGRDTSGTNMSQRGRHLDSSAGHPRRSLGPTWANANEPGAQRYVSLPMRGLAEA
jgi:hypothetical protein